MLSVDSAPAGLEQAVLARRLGPSGQGVRRLESPVTVMLGAPIGTVEFEHEILQARIGKIEGVLVKLASLEDPHEEFALLRTYFSLPKLSYALRTVDPARQGGVRPTGV